MVHRYPREYQTHLSHIQLHTCVHSLRKIWLWGQGHVGGKQNQQLLRHGHTMILQQNLRKKYPNSYVYSNYNKLANIFFCKSDVVFLGVNYVWYYFLKCILGYAHEFRWEEFTQSPTFYTVYRPCTCVSRSLEDFSCIVSRFPNSFNLYSTLESSNFAIFTKFILSIM
jgi:hypothetical protein